MNPICRKKTNSGRLSRHKLQLGGQQYQNEIFYIDSFGMLVSSHQMILSTINLLTFFVVCHEVDDAFTTCTFSFVFKKFRIPRRG